jgi:hypothetical protein
MRPKVLLNEAKYRVLAAQKGPSAALTELHKDLEVYDRWFVRLPYQPTLSERQEHERTLKKFRDFSRVLWHESLEKA